jgi:hypothetical protein
MVLLDQVTFCIHTINIHLRILHIYLDITYMYIQRGILYLNKILKLLPILFVIYFIIFIYNENSDQLIFTDLVLPFIIIIPTILFFSIIIKFIIKNDTKSILISSFLTIIFFIYMPIHNALYEFQIGRNTFLIPIFFISSLIIIIFFIKSKKNFEALLKISYVIVLALIIFNIGEISFYSNIYSIFMDMDDNLIQFFSIDKKDYRDVYHIILDEHAGTTSLQQYHNYNNSKFDNSLQNMGFFIPEKSFSNYDLTTNSIPSILNMDYLDNEFNLPEKEFNTKINIMVENNAVSKIFEENGYEMIYFYNEYNLEPTDRNDNELCNNDLFISNNNLSSTKFMTFIFNNTPILIVQNLFDLRGILHIYSPTYVDLAQNRLCVFNELPFLDEEFLGPIFVHAHIILPHEPAIFSSDGSINSQNKQIPDAEKDSLYLSQLNYTDSLVLELVEKLLVKEPQPIILIQSDHGYRAGPDIRESFSNFAAYYFPNIELNANDYSIITPVNSFRILFNNNFGTSYDLLENKMYSGYPLKDITASIISNSTFNKLD